MTSAEIPKSTVGIVVRPIASGDRERWAGLFRAYREFYTMAADEQVVDRVWGWIADDAHQVNALVATLDGTPVGIAHYRRFARPSAGTTGIYLDDLFTDPDSRGRGAGAALIRGVADIARGEGASVVRWITAVDNARARRLYDSVAIATPWVTYDLAP